MAAGELTPDRGLRLRGMPVLMYHGLIPDAHLNRSAEDKYWVGAAAFGSHLHLIRAGGLGPLRLGELWNGRVLRPDSPRPAAITFDDGHASDYELAFPALQNAGMHGNFFVNTAVVGKAGFLTWARIAEMQRAGMSFQSHSHDHVSLVGLSSRRLESQLRESKRLLEDHLGTAVDFLAAPYGLLNRRVVKVARQLGYRAVCSSLAWPARPGARVISRIAVYRDTTPQQLVPLLQGRPLPYARGLARSALAYLPKRLLLRFRPGRLGVRVLETRA